MGCCGSAPANVTDMAKQKKKEDIKISTSMPEQTPIKPKVEPKIEEEAPKPKDEKPWKTIPIPDVVKINCHPHEIHKFTDTN